MTAQVQHLPHGGAFPTALNETPEAELGGRLRDLERAIGEKLGYAAVGSDESPPPDFGDNGPWGPWGQSADGDSFYERLASRWEKHARDREEKHASLMAGDPEYRADHETAVEIRAEVAVRERIRELTGRGIPDKCAQRIARSGIEETKAVKACRRDERIVVLSGPPGVGKTVAASEAAMGGQFIKAAKLARTSYYDDAAMQNLERPAMLVIDDLGTEYNDAKGMFTAILDSLIDTRYAANLRTVITTNLNAKAFTERYGERVVDRIREAGSFVELAGNSMRRRAKR